MKKLDITNQTDRELSLLVFNTEWLYDQRKDRRFFITLLETFIYTHAQLKVLIQDLTEEELK